MNHETRMELARQVTDSLLRRHADLLAVAIQGSTAKGEDREHSDLEMVAITRDEPEVRAYQAIHRGIVVEVLLYGLKEAQREAASAGFDWPIAADGWIHYLATHDQDGLLPRLAEAAAHPDERKVVRGARSAMTALYEDVCKMRNFAGDAEDGMIRVMAPFAAMNAARFLGLLNGQYFNGMRNLLKKPRDFETLPEHFWEDYPTLLTADADPQVLLAKAERLHVECRDLWVKAGHAPIDVEESLEDALAAGPIPRES